MFRKLIKFNHTRCILSRIHLSAKRMDEEILKLALQGGERA
jgi:hypothetical protein